MDYSFNITASEHGILAGAYALARQADRLNLSDVWTALDGAELTEGTVVFQGRGSAGQVVAAEDALLACIGKTSGVATAANLSVSLAGRMKVVCGAWKKVAATVKEDLRNAVITGGAGIRLTEKPFVYLDKNYVRILGSIRAAVSQAACLDGRVVAVQVRGDFGPIGLEALEAVNAGAGIIMVDTGRLDDLKRVVEATETAGVRSMVEIAFAGGAGREYLPTLAGLGADIVDMGRAILDAPLLDFRLDVINWRTA